MEELELLKKILDQELGAENRYVEHINKIKTPIIRKLLKDLKAEESKHKRQILKIIKNLDRKFDDKKYAESDKIEEERPGTEDFILVQALLETDKEAEEEAMNSYKEAAELTNYSELKTLFIEFKNDEEIHLKKIKNLIDQLSLFNR
ncbi:MAG: ferritin-like domain-containing protein [Candidatus Nanoarchaeia archaeon]|nr:ferritin-like domain-containing protein [Candidatus Nanoarchaeia archaeon]